MTARGNRVGGIHDLATNCGLINAPAAANNATLSSDVTGTAGAILVETDNEFSLNGVGDEAANFYFNFTNLTWSLYVAYDSSGLHFMKSGTFTITPHGPPVPNRRLPASTGIKAKQ